jgi:hypothetical protein
MGTFFSIIDTIRDHSLHNFGSVCIFGVACWGLLKIATLIKRPSFAQTEQVQRTHAVLARKFGTPSWVGPAVWAGLFLVMINIFVVLFYYRSALHLQSAFQFVLMAAFAFYLLSCQRAERLLRTYLRRWYPDRPQVAIGADGLWITGTEIPWSAVRGIERRTRRLKAIGVDTIVVEAQAGKRLEPIEIDLSDSVENPDELFAKLRSAVASHGVPATPVRQSLSALSNRIEASREKTRAAREKYDEWQATLPAEIAKTEAQLADVTSQIPQAESKISDLETALSFGPDEPERRAARLEQARRNLEATRRLQGSLSKLLATQKQSLKKRS